MTRSPLTTLVVLAALSTGCAQQIQVPTQVERAIVQDELVWQLAGKPVELYPGEGERIEALQRWQDAYGDEGKPVFLHTDYRSAYDFCDNMQRHGEVAGRNRTLFGLAVTAIGAIATGALTTLAARDTDAGKEKSQWRSVGEGAAAGGAAVVTAVGAYLLLRGIAAASASSKAAAALTDMPVLSNKSKDWTKCLSIRNEWAEGDYEAAKSFGGVSGGK